MKMRTKLKYYYIVSFFLYLWVTCNGQFSDYALSETPKDYVSIQAEAFENRQLSLLITPNPELLKLSNPYDPKLNKDLILHDATLYNGKYYLYFSPLLALLIVLPIKILSGFYLPMKLISTIFSFGISFLMIKIWSLYFQNEAKKIEKYIYPGILFGTPIMYFQGRIEIYETLISSAVFFLFLALYLLLKNRNSKYSSTELFIFGLAISLSIFQRPNLIFAGLILYVSILWQLKNSSSLEIGNIVSLFVSPIIFGLLTCVYNYLRFNSIFEFGTKFQLVGIDLTGKSLISITHIFPNLFAYISNQIELNLVFPFFHATPARNLNDFASSVMSEHFIGIFALPLSFFLLVYIIELFRNKNLHDGLFLIFALGTITLLINSMIISTTNRYSIEFTLFYSLVEFIVGSKFVLDNEKLAENESNSIVARDVVKTFFMIALLMSILINILLSLEGYGGLLAMRSPNQYLFLERIFTPGF